MRETNEAILIIVQFFLIFTSDLSDIDACSIVNENLTFTTTSAVKKGFPLITWRYNKVRCLSIYSRSTFVFSLNGKPEWRDCQRDAITVR